MPSNKAIRRGLSFTHRAVDPPLPGTRHDPSSPLIGIVIGSSHEARFGEKHERWIHEIAKQRTDLAQAANRLLDDMARLAQALTPPREQS